MKTVSNGPKFTKPLREKNSSTKEKVKEIIMEKQE